MAGNEREVSVRTLILGISLVFSLCAEGFAAPSPIVSSATDGIFVAFQTHPLVGLQEWHGLAQELDFYATLVRDLRFAKEVGNVVLETGDAAQQAVIDRYVAGEYVSYSDLRKVWADTVGWFPTVTFAGSINLYATIRDVNLKLPPENRIKVWLGEPPIDWPATKTKEQWEVLLKQRDSYPADLIAREILAKSKKALVIYGAAHLGIYPGDNTLRSRIETDHPDAFFIVSPYVGYGQPACATRFERHIKDWPTPSLVAPIRRSSLEQDIFQPGCNAFARSPTTTDAQYEASGQNNLGLNSDALLYLGPRKGLLLGPKAPDIYLDLDFRAEMNRRMVLRTGEELSGSATAGNPAISKPYW
jgi:hypothetical protein